MTPASRFVLVLALLGATAARAEEQPSMALLLATPGPGVVVSELTAAETGVAKELGKSGVVQLMPRVQAVNALDVGHRKQLTKCKKDAGCLAQVAGVLQAELAATLDVTHVAKGTSITLTVIAVKTERELGSIQKTFKAKTELPVALKAISDDLAAALAASPEFGAPPPVRTTRVEARHAPVEAPEEPKPAPVARQAAPAAPEAEEEEAPAPPPKAKAKKSRPEPAGEDEERALARHSGESASPASPQPTRTSNGFVIGFDFGYGLWGVDPAAIARGTPGDAPLVEGETPETTAAGFTAPLNGKWLPDINLHLGWNILGYAAVEGVFQMSWWDLFVTQRGGTGLVGGRATIYPLQFFLPNRSFDVGLEGGGGYTIAGGPTYGMEGTYAEFGVTAEYYLGRNISIGLFYRLFLPMWNHFFVDYNNQATFPVKGFMGSWNTLGLTLNFHVAP